MNTIQFISSWFSSYRGFCVHTMWCLVAVFGTTIILAWETIKFQRDDFNSVTFYIIDNRNHLFSGLVGLLPQTTDPAPLIPISVCRHVFVRGLEFGKWFSILMQPDNRPMIRHTIRVRRITSDNLFIFVGQCSSNTRNILARGKY